MDGETICHEVRTKVTGADVLMKPAAPGTGIIAGGTVRAIMGLTGVKNLISKSLGSTNKVNIAYAVIEGLKAQVPRNQWTGAKAETKTEVKRNVEAKKAEVKEKVDAKKVEVKEKVDAKKAEVKKKAEAKKAEVKEQAETMKADVKEKVKEVKKKVETKKSAKKEDE